MFLTYLVVKMTFFYLPEKPLRQINLFCRELRFEYHLNFAKFGAFWQFFDLFGCQNVIFDLPEKPLRQINLFCRELRFKYLFAFCKIWGILTCFWLIWLSKCHFSFARKTLEANQFVFSRASIWVPICILQNLGHFDMFLTYLVVKMSFFICQKKPWNSFCQMATLDFHHGCYTAHRMQIPNKDREIRANFLLWPLDVSSCFEKYFLTNFWYFH